MRFSSKQHITPDYCVVFPIKESKYAETYRVKTPSGERLLLKLIDPRHLEEQQKTPQGTSLEIEVLDNISGPHLPRLVDSGHITLGGHDYEYLVTDYLSSETLADRLLRQRTLSVHDARQVTVGVLTALCELHEGTTPTLHNEVTALNVLINLTTNDLTQLCLIDYGHATKADQTTASHQDLEWGYLAPERFDGQATIQTDIYAVGALLYQMVYGMLPWQRDLSALPPDKLPAHIVRLKKTPLPLPALQVFELDERLANIMRKALAADPTQRFLTAREMLNALTTPTAVEAPEQQGTMDEPSPHTTEDLNGGGFADVAGMDDLKQFLQDRVIRILRDTELARRYRLHIPNGLLFYGPPGCGKTFLAEKFAQEAGYHFQFIKSSDLASIYVHGSQEKIGRLFEEARKNAPTILCFDEFDALVPKRGGHGTEHQAGEVNEFLTQLNNCSQHRIFVIATSNRPDMIDPAIIRTGRIDEIIYIPLPDATSRAAIFRLHMAERPQQPHIDYDRLATRTEGFIASDIAYVVNEAAMRAAFAGTDISTQHLESVIAERRPSVSPSEAASYQSMRERIEGIAKERPRIGFA